MRAVAEPVRVPTGDLEPVTEPVVVRVAEVDTVEDVEGEPETVSATDVVGEADSRAVRVVVAVPVTVRVVETLRDAVDVTVDETVPTVDTDAVVEGDPETVGSAVPVGV